MWQLPFVDVVRKEQLRVLQNKVSDVLTQPLRCALLVNYQGMRATDSNHALAQEQLARLKSLEQGEGTAWLDVLPCKHHQDLDDATVKSALHLMLGVSPGPPHEELSTCIRV
jgi:hypothetical protein